MNNRREPVRFKCSEGPVTEVVGARPSVLRGDLVNKSCKKEPVCLKSSVELVNEDCKREPVCLKCSEGLVTVNSKSSSVCVEGRARQ